MTQVRLNPDGMAVTWGENISGPDVQDLPAPPDQPGRWRWDGDKWARVSGVPERPRTETLLSALKAKDLTTDEVVQILLGETPQSLGIETALQSHLPTAGGRS